MVDTHHLKSWTATFSEQAGLAAMPQAQLAGLKRLLRDAGYTLGAIDGKPDKAADKALADFRKRLRLSPTATDADLFDALETEALKTATPAGYAICNDTAKSVAAAIGEKLRSELDLAWLVEDRRRKLRQGDHHAARVGHHISVRAESRRPGAGHGPAKFCVADIEFDIQGRARCAQRGLTETGFAETRVKGLTGYAVHVGENGLKPPPHRPGDHIRQ